MEKREPRRLLILDDEPAMGLILSRIADRAGWSVQATTKVSVFQAQISSVVPDAIMLDLHLDAADGIEQLRFLQERGYDGPIVLMSGADRVLQATSELGRSLGLAIVGALSKPASNDQVREFLATLARHRPVERAVPAAVNEGAEREPLSAARLDRGLSSGELHLEFQPIVSLPTQRLEVLEALARWHHPSCGTVMPDAFIPLAEQDRGVIDRLTRWVVCAAGEQASQLRHQGTPVSIAVNISAKNLHRLDFPDEMLELVTSLELLPAAIILEITETAATGDPTVTRDILTRLRLKGFRLAMDDFGTGFSSLKALLNSPFSELKIDKSFVADLLTSHDARFIVKSVAHLAQDLGLKTVAEGVESREVLDQLIEFGVDSAQGFHISRALNQEQLAAWLADHRVRFGAAEP